MTNTTTEQWKPVTIDGFEHLYEVSNLGNIRRTGTAHNLMPLHVGSGYLDVILCNSKKRKQIKIHRVVALAFLDNPENKPCVNHLDENKHNNAVTNLSWCTRKENMNWNDIINRSLNTRKQNANKIVAMYDADGNIVDTAKTITLLCKIHAELNYPIVAQCLSGSTKKHKGYTFKYIDYER